MNITTLKTTKTFLFHVLLFLSSLLVSRFVMPITAYGHTTSDKTLSAAATSYVAIIFVYTLFKIISLIRKKPINFKVWLAVVIAVHLFLFL